MSNEKVVETLKERLLYAAGKCSDYSRLESTLSRLTTDYDETLEVYSFDIWSEQSHGTIREKAANMLGVTADLFGDLRCNAEQELYNVMKEIMKLDEKSQLQICNVIVNEDNLSEDRFHDMLANWTDYEYAQEMALESYLGLLKDFLKG